MIGCSGCSATTPWSSCTTPSGWVIWPTDSTAIRCRPWSSAGAPACWPSITDSAGKRWWSWRTCPGGSLQQRYRRGMPNWRAANHEEDVLRKVKRGYFVEWRIADRHKRRLFDVVDFLLDTTRSLADAHLVTASAFRAGLDAATSRPFRLVPFFDPGPWGGTWMEEVVGLEPVGKQLRVVLRLRARGEQPAARRRRHGDRDPGHGPGARSSARAAGRPHLRSLRRRVPDPVRLPGHDGRRQPVAAGASAHRLHHQHVRHALHPGRELLPARRRRRRHGLPRDSATTWT